MLEHAVAYYEDLFQARLMDVPVAEGVIESSLSDKEREEIGQDLSGEEMEAAMISLKGRVAPGGDDLPIEWYKAFWPLIHEDVLGMYRDAIREGILPKSACTGHNAYSQERRED